MRLSTAAPANRRWNSKAAGVSTAMPIGSARLDAAEQRHPPATAWRTRKRAAGPLLLRQAAQGLGPTEREYWSSRRRHSRRERGRMAGCPRIGALRPPAAQASGAQAAT